MNAFFKVCSLALALLIYTPASASAAICNAPPGTDLTWPNPCNGYEWLVDLDSIETGDEIASFTAHVAPGDGVQNIPLFQVFGSQSNGGGGPPTPYPAAFTLFVNGTQTAWTTTLFSGWLYQSLDDFELPEGSTQFRVVFDTYSGPNPVTPFATLKFGDVIAAIPVPAGIWGSLSACLILLGVRKTRTERSVLS